MIRLAAGCVLYNDATFENRLGRKKTALYEVPYQLVRSKHPFADRPITWTSV